MGPADKFISDGSIKAETYEESSAVLGRSLLRLAQFCKQKGITLWIIKQVPEIDERQPAKDMLMYALGRRAAPPPNKGTSMDQHQLRQERANQLFAGIASPAVRIVDPAPYLFDKFGYVTICRNGRSCYYDEDHLTIFGASLFEPLFTEMFVEMKSQRSSSE